MGFSVSEGAIACRLDLNNPYTSVCGIVGSGGAIACRLDLNNPHTSVCGILGFGEGCLGCRLDLEQSTRYRSCEKLESVPNTNHTEIRRLGRGQSLLSRFGRFKAPPLKS